MMFDRLWSAVEAELADSPRVAQNLRPPVSETDVESWEAATGGPLPADLIELYRGHDGAEPVTFQGFSFIGGWAPLPAAIASRKYAVCREMADVWGISPVIPFAQDLSGVFLAVPADGSKGTFVFFLDTPPMPHMDSIETLLRRTVDGLRGQRQDYRAELTDQLTWTRQNWENI